MSSIYRVLRPGELPPAGVAPRRYKTSDGYIRLRWRVGVRQYVECLEHRWVMQCFDPELHVHHINAERDDNRPENLEVLTPAEHAAEHESVYAADAIKLYASGLSIPEVARRLGCDHAGIYRLLVRRGVTIRAGSTYHVRYHNDDVIRALHTEGVRCQRIAKALGMSHRAVWERVKAMDLPQHRVGRPTQAETKAAHKALAELGLRAA